MLEARNLQPPPRLPSGVQLWFSIERSVTEARAAKPITKAIATLQAASAEAVHKGALDWDVGRGIVWWEDCRVGERSTEQDANGNYTLTWNQAALAQAGFNAQDIIADFERRLAM